MNDQPTRRVVRKGRHNAHRAKVGPPRKASKEVRKQRLREQKRIARALAEHGNLQPSLSRRREAEG